MIVATILPVEPAKTFPLRLRILLVVALLFAVASAVLHLGRWLVVEDPLQPAAAIAVLSGNMPSRVLEAARLYKRGCAPQVWLTHSLEPGASLQKLSIPFTGEETYDKLILIHEGVPEGAIRLLDPPIVNTADEMETIGLALTRERDRRVILVTSKVHTRRTRTLWKRLCGRNGLAIVRGVSDDGYDPSRWWSNTKDALDVVREVLGLFNAWAGLPLRPAK